MTNPEIKVGDEIDIQVTVSGEVWESVTGELMVGGGYGYHVDGAEVLAHRPTAPALETNVPYLATVRGTDGVLVFWKGSGNRPWNRPAAEDGLNWYLDSEVSDVRPAFIVDSRKVNEQELDDEYTRVEDAEGNTWGDFNALAGIQAVLGKLELR